MHTLFDRLKRFISNALRNKRIEELVGHSQTILDLMTIAEERSRTLESIVTTSNSKLTKLELLIDTVEHRTRTLETLIDTVEQRTRTLEFVANQSMYILNFQIDQLHKLYSEQCLNNQMLRNNEFFKFTKEIELKTDFPIALTSNDHLMPDSTAEGLSRPTLFVRHCIDVLGGEIKTLDIGTGAAGLVYEWAVNDVLAAGIDGSDYCRKNKIGYWPLLSNNLLTCDITKQFRFINRNDSSQIYFDLITSWEVLEHISESELPILFENVRNHLNANGYFIGSISLLEYNDQFSNPYHVTLKPSEWWKSRFDENGLKIVSDHPFNTIFFCRGNGPRFQDFHNYKRNPEEGFWFVATLK